MKTNNKKDERKNKEERVLVGCLLLFPSIFIFVFFLFLSEGGLSKFDPDLDQFFLRILRKFLGFLVMLIESQEEVEEKEYRSEEVNEW